MIANMSTVLVLMGIIYILYKIAIMLDEEGEDE